MRPHLALKDDLTEYDADCAAQHANESERSRTSRDVIGLQMCLQCNQWRVKVWPEADANND